MSSLYPTWIIAGILVALAGMAAVTGVLALLFIGRRKH